MRLSSRHRDFCFPKKPEDKNYFVSDHMKPYTTGQMAKLLGVREHTVRKMALNGLLTFWRTDEGGHMRFSSTSVFPLLDNQPGGISWTQFGIYLLENDQENRNYLLARLKQDFPLSRVLYSSNIYDALIQIGRQRPNIIIANAGLASERDFAILRSIRNNEATRGTLVLLQEDSESQLRPWDKLEGEVSFVSRSDIEVLIRTIRVFLRFPNTFSLPGNRSVE